MSRPLDVAARVPRSVPDALGWLRAHFRSDLPTDLQVTYQVDLRGEGGGIFWARVDGGRLSFGEGRTPRPDVAYQMDAGDFYAILVARENPELLYLEDRIRIEGSMSLALELRVLFLTRVAS
ncbi:MAG: SCP2 sterol-binding domain-containing protein [bacterium]|nr:SCP2 sterol-binding domain-containing protein [bacterium]